MSLEQREKLVTVKQYTSEGEEGTIFFVELAHKGLDEHKVFSSVDHPMLVTQVRNQLDIWEEQWLRPQAQQVSVEENPASVRERENRWEEAEHQVKVQEAKALTLVSRLRIDEIKNILPLALKKKIIIDWDAIREATLKKIREGFEDQQQHPPTRPMEPQHLGYPAEPDFQNDAFRPRLNLMDKAIGPLKSKKKGQAYRDFQIAYKQWRRRCGEIDKEYEQSKETYANDVKSWEKDMTDWKATQEEIHHKEQEALAEIDRLKRNYEQKEAAAVLEYCEMVLGSIEYPEAFPKDFMLDYSAHDQTLMLEHAMPTLQEVFMLGEAGNTQEKNEPDTMYLDDHHLAVYYDHSLYSISLGILHALLRTDLADAIKGIKFNGWLASFDQESGQEEKKCIFSLHTTKNEFLEIRLHDGDPETCFKQLGGVTHAQLNTLAPDGPVVEYAEEEMNTAESVIAHRNEPDNITTMSQDDFEHLIRSLLENEFGEHGEEINILQADSEGEVKAVVFDPNPIRGGKIMVYVQRNRPVVGLSAAKALFEDVMHGGAIKGIFITSSGYEEEAYIFAKDKPLTLLNGTDLLALLEKHGYALRIDFHETDSIS